MQFPEQLRAPLHAQVEFEVTRLVDEVDFPVFALKSSRSEPAHAPTAHAVCTAGEIAPFVGQDCGVAIRLRNAEGGVNGHRGAVGEDDAFAEIKV